MALDVHGVTGSSPVLSTIKAPKSVDFGAFSCILQSKSSTIFLKSRFDPNRDPNRDVRRCTKQYEIARKDHSAAHKTHIKSAFFHEKRGALPFWQRARYALHHTTSRLII